MPFSFARYVPRHLSTGGSPVGPHCPARCDRWAGVAWTSVLLVGCGGGTVSSEAAHTPISAPMALQPDPKRLDMSSSAEVGGLNEREAEQSFVASLDALQTCVADGVERFSFMGGSIELKVKVDASHRARQVWAVQSSLGERSTEKCMFEALRSVEWPAPVGGPYGIARNSFEFEMRKGVAAPAVWDAGRVAGVLDHVDGSLRECEGREPGQLRVTLYIGEGGRALAGGAASEEPMDDAAVDCVVDTLLAARYPAPERIPTKVRFQL